MKYYIFMSLLLLTRQQPSLITIRDPIFDPSYHKSNNSCLYQKFAGEFFSNFLSINGQAFEWLIRRAPKKTTFWSALYWSRCVGTNSPHTSSLSQRGG